MSTASSAAPARSTGAGSWLRWTVAALFGLLYAWAVWLAVFNLAAQAGGEAGLNGAGWAVMLMPVIFPALIYVAAFLFGRRRRVWQLALMFVAGLGLVAVFWLDVVMYMIRAGGSLIGS